jgi:hypothetical protein
MRSASLGLALAATLIFAGCSGGGSSSTPSSGTNGGTNSGSSTTTQSESAITTTNSVGEPMKSLTNYNNSVSPQSEARNAQSLQLGVCQAYSGGGSYEFFSPDKNSDTNSTEEQYFYDNSCTQLARDEVRIWSSTGASSENVTHTMKIYALGNATPSATRTDAVALTNATFDQYGFPNPANGFDRVDTGNLNIAGSNTVNSDFELVMLPLSGSSESFCGDSAGYNATGIASLGETFGWQGGVFSTGSRTVNADGSVTWNATHTGSTAKGAVGSLSIGVGTQNTGCPITKPMFTLSGGTSLGSYTIPTVATYKAGLLINLTIANASLANGTTLNVTTNTNVSPTSNLFITGTIASGGSQIATFNVDAFGDGTLTMTSSGAQHVITDWQVVS